MIITDDYVVINFPKTGSTFVRTVLKKLHKTQMDRRNTFTKVANKLGMKHKPMFQELMLPNIKVIRGSGDDQHGTYQQIPSQHKGKQIISIVRNPYERLISQYEFQWWAKYPPLEHAVLALEFPCFPNLTLNEYLRFQELNLTQNRIPHIALNTDIGNQTVQFIQMFFRKPNEVLENLDEDYIRSNRFVDDMPKITFLRTEHLNQDLYDFLLGQGYPKEDISFILDHNKVNVTKNAKKERSKLWTEEAIQYVQHKERLLFRILKHHGFVYSCPIVSS